MSKSPWSVGATFEGGNYGPVGIVGAVLSVAPAPPGRRTGHGRNGYRDTDRIAQCYKDNLAERTTNLAERTFRCSAKPFGWRPDDPAPGLTGRRPWQRLAALASLRGVMLGPTGWGDAVASLFSFAQVTKSTCDSLAR
jgi:hypothetical protein